jgi:hypothetical protein
MWCEAELKFKNYKPLFIEPGQWFRHTLFKDTKKEFTEIFILDEKPINEQLFIQNNGYPIQPYIMYNEYILANSEQIGWFDESDHCDELHDVDIKEINNIINDYNSVLEINVDITVNNLFEYDEYGPNEVLTPVIYMDKVLIRYVNDKKNIDDVTDYTYVLVLWPESQELMGFEWFDLEASLADSDKFGSSAYFIPQSRWMELNS